jgi:hypothetical protein
MTEFGADRDKYRSLRGRTRVRELFWQQWDPIGVNVEGSGAEGEYDRYADKAYAMLVDEDQSAQEIADYLYRISSEDMGIGTSQRLKDLAKSLAVKLIALKPTLDSESNEPF